MIAYREPPSKSFKERVPFLVFLVCFIGLLAYFAAAPAFEDELNPPIGFFDWVKRFAGLTIVLAVVLGPLAIAALHERATSRARRDLPPRES